MTQEDNETAKRIQGWAWIIAGTFRCSGGVCVRSAQIWRVMSTRLKRLMG